MRSWTVARVRGSAEQLHRRDPWAGGSLRRVWICECVGPAVVLGSTQPAAHVDLARAGAAGVEVVRRRSGGGAVLVVPGETVWVDVAVPHGDPLWEADVGRAFAWLGRAWADAMDSLALGEPGSGSAPPGSSGSAPPDPRPGPGSAPPGSSGSAPPASSGSAPPGPRPGPGSAWSASGCAVVHEGPMVGGPWSGYACFAGLGPGEVSVGGRKVVGLSQRRTRQGAVFHCALHLTIAPSALAALLVLDDSRRADAAEALDALAAPLSELVGMPPVTSPEVETALLACMRSAV